MSTIQDPKSANQPENFKAKSLEERRERFAKLQEKNPSKVPIIFERHPQSKLPESNGLKFMSTKNLKLRYFADQVKTALKLTPECSLFFSCGKSRIVKHDSIIGELYESAKSDDGFLYIQYREVESFGRN